MAMFVCIIQAALYNLYVINRLNFIDNSIIIIGE